MPIPTYDKLLRPILRLADRQEITGQSATAAMSQLFKLSPKESQKKIPSGQSTLIRNRTSWAMTFLTKGGLIEKVAPKTYRASALGRNFLSKHPNELTVRDLHQISGWEDAW